MQNFSLFFFPFCPYKMLLLPPLAKVLDDMRFQSFVFKLAGTKDNFCCRLMYRFFGGSLDQRFQAFSLFREEAALLLCFLQDVNNERHCLP